MCYKKRLKYLLYKSVDYVLALSLGNIGGMNLKGHRSTNTSWKNSKSSKEPSTSAFISGVDIINI